jgi:hypothetical protein
MDGMAEDKWPKTAWNKRQKEEDKVMLERGVGS